MPKIKIKVPATTANLGPGFDCLGLALNLYNDFIFEESECFSFIGFDERFTNDSNYIVKSAKRAFQYKRKEIVYFKVELIENVPLCRGLGSSATLIVAGILIANYFMNNALSNKEVLKLAAEMEGHPDNAAPAILGGLVASYLNKGVNSIKYIVNPELFFYAAIPDFVLATKKAREVLPKTISYSKIVYSMSRAINIPRALELGDEVMLFDLLLDKLHQPFRMPLIEEAFKFKSYSIKNSIPFCISGSGSTLLFITKKDILQDLEKIETKNNWKILKLKAIDTGAELEVLYEK